MYNESVLIQWIRSRSPDLGLSHVLMVEVARIIRRFTSQSLVADVIVDFTRLDKNHTPHD